MSEKILSYFVPGLSDDDNKNIDFMVNDLEYHLPIGKMYDFWNDYFLLEHNLIIKEIPSNYMPVIIDFCQISEIDNTAIGKFCERLTEEIKDMLDCTTADFKCYVFKKIEDPKKLRIIFPHFFMKRKIICTLLYKSLYDRYVDGTVENKILSLYIPFYVDLFDERHGYKFHGLVDKTKFKVIKNLNFNHINKGIKGGILYNTYCSLLEKYQNEILIPIIFSINNKKLIAKTKYPVKNKLRYGAELCQQNIINNIGGVCDEVIPSICQYLFSSKNENTSVPDDKIKKLVNTVGDMVNKHQKITKNMSNIDPILNYLSHNPPSIYFMTINQNIINYYGNDAIEDQSKEKQKAIDYIYNCAKKIDHSELNGQNNFIFENLVNQLQSNDTITISEMTDHESNPDDEDLISLSFIQKIEFWLSHHVIVSKDNYIKNDDFYEYYYNEQCDKCSVIIKQKIKQHIFIKNINKILTGNIKFNFMDYKRKSGFDMHGYFICGGCYQTEHISVN